MPVHDRDGKPGGPIDRSEHELSDWELLADAIVGTLARKRVITLDEHRRAIESLGAAEYEAFPPSRTSATRRPGPPDRADRPPPHERRGIPT